MFVILLRYVKPLEEVDGHMKSHVAFLKKHYAEGKFLMSGRRTPRTGGVILASGDCLQEIEAIMSEDPFHTSGCAEYEIVQFNPSMTSPEFSKFQQWPK